MNTKSTNIYMNQHGSIKPISDIKSNHNQNNSTKVHLNQNKIDIKSIYVYLNQYKSTSADPSLVGVSDFARYTTTLNSRFPILWIL